jgi:predicted nucleotidyltransferase
MMSITPEQMQVYRQTARERSLARQARMVERRERAWALARRAAALLKEEYGATRVVVFGSLTNPLLFHERSDIDLAVWGIAERRYDEATERLQRLDFGFRIDLVQFADAQPLLQAAIERNGVSL